MSILSSITKLNPSKSQFNNQFLNTNNTITTFGLNNITGSDATLIVAPPPSPSKPTTGPRPV